MRLLRVMIEHAPTALSAAEEADKARREDVFCGGPALSSVLEPSKPSKSSGKPSADCADTQIDGPTAEKPGPLIRRRAFVTLLEQFATRESAEVGEDAQNEDDLAQIDSKDIPGDDTGFREPSGNEPVDENEPPAPGVQLIIDILRRCSYFAASPILRVAIAALDTIEAGLSKLQTAERHLLPLVHEVSPAPSLLPRNRTWRQRGHAFLPFPTACNLLCVPQFLCSALAGNHCALAVGRDRTGSS